MALKPEVVPADERLKVLRENTATIASVPLLAASIMAKKLATGVDGSVMDVKVGSGGFLQRQLDARRLGQMMVAIGRRMDKRVQALITDMSQPLGYAIGNALEVMEVSQTLQNVGPADLTRLSLELAARMILLGGITATIEEARETAQEKLLDGSGYQKLKEVIEAQGGNPKVMDRFDLLPNATGAREIASPRSGFISVIDADDIGRAAAIIGGSRQVTGGVIDPAVGVILEVKVGQRVDEGAVLCRLYHTREEGLDEAAQAIEDAFRISNHAPDERELILEIVG
jgi:pyrimidine-nucleoside phosphorylase/thymidine phosphorylase